MNSGRDTKKQNVLIGPFSHAGLLEYRPRDRPVRPRQHRATATDTGVVHVDTGVIEANNDYEMTDVGIGWGPRRL